MTTKLGFSQNSSQSPNWGSRQLPNQVTT